MIQRVVERMYDETEENRFLEVTYANGDKETLYFKDFNSGAMIQNIVDRSKKSAIKSVLETGQPGLRVQHLLDAIVDEFAENEDLPNTTNPDDWARISGKKGERIVYIRTLVTGKNAETGRAIDTAIEHRPVPVGPAPTAPSSDRFGRGCRSCNRCPIRSRPAGRSAPTVSRMTIEAQLDAIGIVAADMAKSLAFYRALGLAVPDGADDQPHVEVHARRRHAADVRHRGDGPLVPPGLERRLSVRGGSAWPFALPDAAAVDAAYAELTAAGHHGELEPFDALWGQRYASVNDPDGNGVDLFAPLAR